MANSYKLLLVDDDEVDREMVRRALAKSGMAVQWTEAPDASAAMGYLTHFSFDCVLLDLKLGADDGRELLARARAAGVTAPVIALTGFGDEETAVQLLKAGAADYLPKSSVTPERLSMAVRHAIRLHGAEIEAEAARKALDRHVAMLNGLTDVTHELNACLGHEGIAERLAQAILGLFKCGGASVVRRNAQGEISEATAPGQAASDPRSRWRPLLDSDELGTPRLLAASDLKTRPGLFKAIEASLGAPKRWWLGAPMLARDGRVLGTLQLIDPPDGSVPSNDLAILVQLARLAATAFENAQVVQQTQAASKAREETLAVVSHDLRNPLAVVSGAVSVLQLKSAQAGMPLKQAAPEIERIGRAARQMSALVDDLLDATRIEAGNFRIDLAVQSPGEMLSDAVELLQPLATQRRLTLKASIPAGLGPVRADRARVLQVLSNLGGNAIKFTPEGGTIEITAEEDAHGLRVSVVDSGPGIAPEHLARLFDRYWQAGENARQGVGLGLYIARGIVEAHGGRLQVTSRLGHGTRFTFDLPTSGERREQVA